MEKETPVPTEVSQDREPPIRDSWTVIIHDVGTCQVPYAVSLRAMAETAYYKLTQHTLPPGFKLKYSELNEGNGRFEAEIVTDPEDKE